MSSKESFKFKYTICDTSTVDDCDYTFEDSKSIQHDNNILFGEISSKSIDKLVYNSLIEWKKIKTVVDWGMGSGKILLQLFEICPKIELLVGAEILISRYDLAVGNITNLHDYLKNKNININISHNYKEVVLTRVKRYKKTNLIISNKSMYEHKQHMKKADLIFMDIAVPSHMEKILHEFIKETKIGSIIISYENMNILIKQNILKKIYQDNIYTSWSNNKGHNFNWYKRI